MSRRPIGLSDDQLSIIERLVEPLHRDDRWRFLERVAQLLDGVEIGDGAISRAGRQAQGELFRGVDMVTAPRLSKHSRAG